MNAVWIRTPAFKNEQNESFTFEETNLILEPILVDDVHGEVDGVGHVDADHLGRGAEVGAEHREDAGAAPEVEDRPSGNLKQEFQVEKGLDLIDENYVIMRHVTSRTSEADS